MPLTPAQEGLIKLLARRIVRDQLNEQFAAAKARGEIPADAQLGDIPITIKTPSTPKSRTKRKV